MAFWLDYLEGVDHGVQPTLLRTCAPTLLVHFLLYESTNLLHICERALDFNLLSFVIR